MSKKHKGPRRPAISNPAIHPDRLFYWAYGSNLCVEQMRHRCPGAQTAGPMAVQDCALVFRSVADVTLRGGSVTPGGLWLITDRCEEALDAYEGVANRMYMKRYFMLKIDGRQRTCLFYQMRASKGIMPPTRMYLSTIAAGYEDFGLDPAALKAALDESWSDKSMTQALHDRAERNGWPRLARELPASKEERAELVAERMRSYRPERILIPKNGASVGGQFTDQELADALESEGRGEGDEDHGGLRE